MTVWGIARVKDEADVIGETVAHMLEQVDHVLVADNDSTDDTGDILNGLAVTESRLTLMEDHEVAYYQSQQMSNLAAVAAAGGATWVVPFDADEWWYCPHADTIGDWLRGLGETTSRCVATLFDQVATGRDDKGHPFDTMRYRRVAPAPLPKVAARPLAPVVIAQGNHDADYGGRADGLIVRHYPYRSLEQFERKVHNGARAYKATNLPDDIGAHWRQYGQILDAQGTLRDVYEEWFYVDDPEGDQSLMLDPCPQ